MKAITATAALKFDARQSIESTRVALASIAYLYAKGGNLSLFAPLDTFRGVSGFIKAHKTLANLVECPDTLPETGMKGIKPTDSQKKAKMALQKAIGWTWADGKIASVPDEEQAMQAAYTLLFPQSITETSEEKQDKETTRAPQATSPASVIWSALHNKDTAGLRPDQLSAFNAFMATLESDPVVAQKATKKKATKPVAPAVETVSIDQIV